ncbi:MAG: hypothetical protein HOV77_16070 [Hamadaea sp.]|uniref:hypothetical protein n=1 Tax=Hamadaea sp. TaxID=2024425 RepID=UPI001847A983|nr:hypothetical protein [Hamadaea sp.]NUT20700.1 hypothetical protein [Hamadaea sp.]
MSSFAADIARLWVVARHQLPAATSEIKAAESALTGTAGSDGSFAAPAVFGGGNGPVMQAWADLREGLESALKKTVDALEDTTTALGYAVRRYENTDADVKSEIEKIKPQYGL